MNAAEARARARDALERAGVRHTQLRLTPPFPEAWPPRPGSALVFYAYAVEALPTGVERYAIDTPRFCITVDPEGETALSERASRPLAQMQESSAGEERLARAEKALVREVFEGGADTAAIRDGYTVWRSIQAALAGVLEPELADFFAWLKVGEATGMR